MTAQNGPAYELDQHAVRLAQAGMAEAGAPFNALLLERRPALAPAEVRARLEAAARDLGAPGRDPDFGAGLVDAARALE